MSQPGLLHDLTERGIAVPLPDEVADTSADAYPAQLLELISTDDRPAAVWLTIDVKGLVWYQPDEFSARDLGVPTTLDELADLSNRIRTGETAAPWCLTMEAGASTGWVGTDWVEDYALRRLGPDKYAEWTSANSGSTARRRRPSSRSSTTLLRAPGAIVGGQRAILNTPWEDSVALLLNEPATCLMAHQADFLRREVPADT